MNYQDNPKKTGFKRILAGILMATALMGAASASADWPTKPIQLVVVFPPGGSADQMGRILAPHISKHLGQNVIVENRGGAGGMIGTAAVAKGNDHMFGVIFDTHATNAQLYKDNISFDSMNDVNFVTLFGTAPLAIFAGKKSEHKRANSLFKASKEGKQLSYGSVGTGGLGHLAMVSLANQGNFAWEHIAYRGGGPLHMDVAANHVDVGISSLLAIKGLVDGGSLVPLAVTTDVRSSVFPDVPTVAELGYEGFNAPTWWGMVSPGATNQKIVDRMYEATRYALQQPDVIDHLTRQGVTIAGSTPGEFKAFVQDQMTQWGKVIQENKVAAGD
ncbi:tripartite tricarboxylate transporter substrate binding protein [Candidimonas sp. SYP-B2681]|uniref:Bug family tripartite tricarboxylate transporter substrate binding protein n=1 Tax=Candidimonas sp. SYP-B2681 TaxID=2497686 RepID=UPI000F897566|nr:tripartite tricarboxylate transporter substrate-binding protein [Candidimonas sp. SYP-B2681]RTZ41469.1 tripartite tricarboxylate transporter substrate binding protein [Candidimonas sp. SYP-B2681]